MQGSIALGSTDQTTVIRDYENTSKFTTSRKYIVGKKCLVNWI